ncbi:hypothetical protein BS50DRAFT_10909 [Corynespora cassiicola Philippines]|uniref:Pentacotripeptide-repeat region of PRORP domain-containing protein n=1 Tax=Corynespora cassiicola Philippines TaxID=1448308 RepID=A0A2T2P981_CORCC|nr:hypothetical protein BS50DRAFT_10909 [Corynespora cassiicola Philippines]
MMSYVCRQCRNRLHQRVVLPIKPQWQARATFISLRRARPAKDTESQPSPEPAQNTTPGQAQAREHDPSSQPWTHQNDGLPRARVGRYSRHLQAREVDESTVQGAPSAPDNAAANTADIQIEAHTRKAHSYAQPIKRHLNHGNLSQAWSLFLETYSSKDCAAIKDPTPDDLPLMNGSAIFGRLLYHVSMQFSKGVEVPATPSTILFRYQQLDLATPLMWRNTFTVLCDQFILAVEESSQERAELILSELLSLWRIFFQCNGAGAKNRELEAISSEWIGIPKEEELKEYDHTSADPFFPARLQQYHPNYVRHPAITHAAVLLFNIFNGSFDGKFKLPDTIQQQGRPIAFFIARLLANARLSTVTTNWTGSPALSTLSDTSKAKIIEQIQSAPKQALIFVRTHGLTSGPEAESLDPELVKEQLFIARIARAILAQSNVPAIERLWAEVLRAYTIKDGRPAIPQSIYNIFLSGYLKMYQAPRSVEVWNHMVAHGVKPDVKTWTAMLEGCGKARDEAGLEAVWSKMLAAGIEPDNYAWTTRIHSLAAIRRINTAFRAMDEMGKRWLAAEQAIRIQDQSGKRSASLMKATNPTTKPSITIVDAAISGIAAAPEKNISYDRKIGFIQKILQWASNFQIKPDVRTYNLLIKVYMSGGNYAVVPKLLKQMELEGIEADIATYTMLINAAFENQQFSHFSEAEQTQHILELFSDLEAAGLKLNAYVYSSIIDRLLKHHNNVSAVRTVLSHMAAKGMIPSPHIYTSLFTFYFQQTPPNIAAIDSLWTQINQTPGVETDRHLFDRLIEGYAGVGEVGKMMAVLTQMSSHGKLPSWTALTSVVQTLLEARDHERARRVIRDVQFGQGVAKGGITGGQFGQRDFYNLLSSFDPELASPFAEYLQQNVDGTDARFSTEDAMASEEMGEARGASGNEDFDLYDRSARTSENGSVGGVPL